MKLQYPCITKGLLMGCLFTSLSACNITTPDKPQATIPLTDKSDGAPRRHIDVATIPDAHPQIVQRTRAGNKSPYTVFGKSYTLLPDSQGYKERGYASWYGTKFHGRRTANGETYDIWGMTAAHKTLPIPSYVRVTNVDNGRSVVVKINDRGPFHQKRIIDLSYAAAKKLGFAEQGVALVDVEDVTPITPKPSSQPFQKPQGVELSPLVNAPVVNSPVVSSSAAKVTPPVPLQASPASPPEKPVVADTPSSVYLQVGAFEKSESANRLQSTLSNLLPAPVDVVSGVDRWFRVRIGPISDPQVMSTTRQLLAEQGFKQVRLVKPI